MSLYVGDDGVNSNGYTSGALIARASNTIHFLQLRYQVTGFFVQQVPQNAPLPNPDITQIVITSKPLPPTAPESYSTLSRRRVTADYRPVPP